LRIGLVGLLAVSTTSIGFALSNRFPTQPELVLVERLHPSDFTHLRQDALLASANRFATAFEQGDAAFSHQFASYEGGGANVGDGSRYTRIPRPDLTGAGQWATHTPSRATGPNAASCDGCHNVGAEDGAGAAVANVHRDPNHTGNLGQMLQRNTPGLLGLAGVQVLAEEMTSDLQDIRNDVRAAACFLGTAQRDLTTHDVNFGTYKATRVGPAQRPPCPVDDSGSAIVGVDADLVIRPFQWKGSVAFIRDFVRGAMHNEIGIQGVELVGDNVDGDGDGVDNELFVGDMTALAVYMAAQARPTTKLEVNNLGLLNPPLSPADISAINRGSTVFNQVGCATCHVPTLTTRGRTFSEPSQNPNFRDATFPAGQDPRARGVSPDNPVRFDITRDQPDNRVPLPGTNGDLLGSFRRVPDPSSSGAVVNIFSDLKRHRMGNDLRESIDEVGTGNDSFKTAFLWGVGSTAPYMHDGRATSLTEAILYHTGASELTVFNGSVVRTPIFTRVNFLNLPDSDKSALLAFLNNLILFRT
jgi:Di-haem oxidoreductase, putative peroxidase